MKNQFINEYSKELYYQIINLNKEIINDKKSISLNQFAIINNSSLLDLCNSIYGTKLFSDEPFCKDFAEMTALIIYRLNTSRCFADGNKRTILLIIRKLTLEFYPNLYNDFFMGSLSTFLIEMLKGKLTKEDVLEWVYNQYELWYQEKDEV